MDVLDDLPGLIGAFDLADGLLNALLVSVDAALASVEQGNAGAAIDQLEAFIYKLEAQTGKGLTPEDADILVAVALHIIDQLQG